MLAIGSVTFLSGIGMLITRLQREALPEVARAPVKAPVKPEFEVVKPAVEPAYALMAVGAILIILFIWFRRKW
jgi:hypothetical protein